MPLSLTVDSVTVEEADAYAASRGRTSWVSAPSSPPATKEAALRRATDWAVGEFNGRWLVEFDADDAPDAVKYAITEGAIRELASPGSLAPDYVPGERVTSEKVGPLGVTYADPKNADDMLPVMRAIDGLLQGLIRPKSGTLVGTVARA